jgi:uncharacterized protein with PQ loop repeat
MDTLKEWCGWLGFAMVLLCWIPQTITTFRTGEARLSRAFLVLTALGSVALFFHAFLMKDMPFMLLNAYAAINATMSVIMAKKEKGEGRSAGSPRGDAVRSS